MYLQSSTFRRAPVLLENIALNHTYVLPSSSLLPFFPAFLSLSFNLKITSVPPLVAPEV